jgi:rhodanese-related sulfurtransferase
VLVCLHGLSHFDHGAMYTPSMNWAPGGGMLAIFLISSRVRNESELAFFWGFLAGFGCGACDTVEGDCTPVRLSSATTRPITVHNHLRTRMSVCYRAPARYKTLMEFSDSGARNMVKLKRRTVLVTGGLFVAGVAWLRPAAAFSLDEVEKDVTADYPSVEHVLPKSVPMAQSGSDGVLLLDVREEDEFAVSHLPGAIRVDPGMDPDDFMARFGGMVAGKQVVFYCSVGVRSSQLAERVSTQLAAAGAREVANLSGGIFRWHNEQRMLVSGRGTTDLVHPYNRKWGALISRQPQISYTPVPGR